MEEPESQVYYDEKGAANGCWSQVRGLRGVTVITTAVAGPQVRRSINVEWKMMCQDDAEILGVLSRARDRGGIGLLVAAGDMTAGGGARGFLGDFSIAGYSCAPVTKGVAKLKVVAVVGPGGVIPLSMCAVGTEDDPSVAELEAQWRKEGW